MPLTKNEQPTPNQLNPPVEILKGGVENTIKIMKAVDELINHQQSGVTHRFKGEQLICHIKQLLIDIGEQISHPNQSEATKKYLVQACDLVNSNLKIEMLKVIIDPYEIARERVVKEFPEGLEYGKFLAKRKIELGDKFDEALKSKEADNLRKLGLDPGEIILRGFITEDEKAIVAINFIENTKKNPLGYIITMLVLVGLVWLFISIFSK